MSLLFHVHVASFPPDYQKASLEVGDHVDGEFREGDAFIVSYLRQMAKSVEVALSPSQYSTSAVVTSSKSIPPRDLEMRPPTRCRNFLGRNRRKPRGSNRRTLFNSRSSLSSLAPSRRPKKRTE